jgi:cation:H+ antiporter
MMPLFTWIILFIVSLFILIKSAGFFTNSAEKIGIFLGIPSFIVGVTIVSIGTSLPELVSSIIAVSKNSSEIVVGNVVGSNITNIFLILGLVAIIGKKLEITYELIHVDLPLLVGSAFLISVTVWDGVFERAEATLCIAGFILYFLYTLSVAKQKEVPLEEGGVVEEKKLENRTLIVLVGSAFFIYLGARYTVESIIEMSKILGIGKEIIAASAVALGTSLPELMVSTTAAKEGKPELAVGNVLGSNIFNAFLVMGVPALFGNLIIPSSILSFALPLMLIATLLYVFITQDKQITQWEGGLLLIFYVFFIGRLFNFF